MKIATRITTLAGMLALYACAAGPDYRPAELDTGERWATQAMVDPTPELTQWWRTLSDPTLTRLVEQAAMRNLDIRQAAALIDEARALRDAAAGGYYPGARTSASYTERRQSENGPLPVGSIPGLDRDQSIYDAGIDASWEIDLFGRTRRAVEAADARVDAAELSAADVRLRVIAEVSRLYFELRGAQHELAARQHAVAAAERTANLVRRRVEGGEEPEASLARTEAELAALQARLPAVRAEVRATALGLGVLLGNLPESELALASTHADYLELSRFPVGERAAVLRRRPDVRAAERKVGAATAEVGVATAELFPRLSIGANGGFEALDIGDLFESASETYSITPLISWRIFDGGRVRASIRAAEARVRSAALDYEQAVLAALTDAERALTRYDAALDALTQQQRAVAAARRSFELAQLRYDAGDITLIELMDADRTLREAEAIYASAHTRAATGLVTLYKALGGGWSADAMAAR